MRIYNVWEICKFDHIQTRHASINTHSIGFSVRVSFVLYVFQICFELNDFQDIVEKGGDFRGWNWAKSLVKVISMILLIHKNLLERHSYLKIVLYRSFGCSWYHCSCFYHHNQCLVEAYKCFTTLSKWCASKHGETKFWPSKL